MAEFIIHRGSHQIGGMCAEVRTKTSRVIIDMGTNLPGNENNGVISDRELIESLFKNEEKKKNNAIIFTHYHGDHIGLFDDLLSGEYDDIKENNLCNYQIYMGQTAKQIKLNLFSTIHNEKLEKIYGNTKGTTPHIDTFSDKENITDIKSICVGNDDNDPHKIDIIPILVNHSALDSYMFLISADGKTMLYTGDYRNHGHFLSGEELYTKINVAANNSKIDYLVTEGTMLSRTDAMSDKGIFSETQLNEKAVTCFKGSKYNFILVSSTNFDSILSFYRAAQENNLAFLCDEYQEKQIKTANELYYKMLDNSSSFDMSRVIKIDDIKKPKYENYQNGFVMLVRAKTEFSSAIKNFAEAFPDKEYKLIYSMWGGYIQKDSENSEEYSRHDDYSQSIYTFLDEFRRKDKENTNCKANIIENGYHTSGHTSKDCIMELIDKIQPQYVIPMHSECSDDIKEKIGLGDVNYCILNDGDVLDMVNYDKDFKTVNIYSDIYRMPRMPENKTNIDEQYKHIAEQVIDALNKNMEDSENGTYKGWVSRFAEYYSNNNFEEKGDFWVSHSIINEIPEGIHTYSPVGAGKNTIQLRKDGALIAHLTYQGEDRGWEVYPEDAAAKYNISSESNTSLLKYITDNRKDRKGAKWDILKIVLSSLALKGKLIEEHKLESAIHTKIESNCVDPKSKSFCNLKPVFLVDGCRFQMPVPFNANQIAKSGYFKYLKKGKGNIDILAKTTDGVLTVIELKDKFEESERPSEAIKQAIIYATFMAKLINTSKAGNWIELFEGNKKEEKIKTENIKKDEINAVICMPIKNSDLRNFNENDLVFCKNPITIDVSSNNKPISVKINLQFIYLDADKWENDDIKEEDKKIELFKMTSL